MGNSSIDLSGWVSSLSDSRLNVISEFNQNGLIPISDFILEDNLKKLFNSFSEGNAPCRNTIEEPYILVLQKKSTNVNTMIITDLNIVTRYGEYINLVQVGGLYNQTNINEFWEIVDKIQDVFQLKIVNNSIVRSREWGPTIGAPYSGYKNFLTNNTSYTKLTYNGMLYFIDEVDKVGFSILNNTIMIAEYGLTDFISKLKMPSLKYEDLIDQNYTINAL